MFVFYFLNLSRGCKDVGPTFDNFWIAAIAASKFGSTQDKIFNIALKQQIIKNNMVY